MFRKILFISLALIVGVAAGCSALSQANPAAPSQANAPADTALSAPTAGVNPGNRAGRSQPQDSGNSSNSDYAQSSTGNRYGQHGASNQGSRGNQISSSQNRSILPAPAASLSQAEIDGLLFMREEEKLAHDVYTTLYTTWGLQAFQSIAQSEQAHMDQVKFLLDRYGLSDPASSEPGVFTNPELQSLFSELVARGSQSLTEALRVGAAIEEIDILDLQELLLQTAADDVAQVYSNLLSGSENHLRAFVNNLSTQGVVYTPQYMSLEAYQAILSGSSGNGRGNQGGAGQGGKGRP